MHGYGSSDDDVVRFPSSSVWESQGLLDEAARGEEPVELDGPCSSPRELVQSPSFQKFLDILNSIDARDGARREMFGFKPMQAEDVLRDKYKRDRAYRLWNTLRFTSKVQDVRNIDERLQQWMQELDVLEEKEREVQTQRHRIGA